MVTINDSKISFVLGSCFADHLWSTVAQPFVWRKPNYVMEHNQLRGGGGYSDVDFAWYPSQKSAFWRYYLGGQALDEVRGPDAWEAMVPFRFDVPRPGLETDRAERIIVDTYAYELGVVIVLTVQPFKRATASLDDWVERLRALRSDPVFLIDEKDGPRSATVTEVLNLIAKNARGGIYGGGGASVSSAEPITIANILQADGGRPGAAPDATLQRYLHAVTAWPTDWHNVLLPALNASPPFLPQRESNRLPNDVLYSIGRSLAIWRPGLFARPLAGAGKRKRHTLSCFGHNLCAAAAQTEYLRLVSMAYAAQSKLRDRLDSGRVRAVGTLMDALIRGAGTTYRSESVRQILSDKASLEQVNQLLVLAGAKSIG